jgi:hypothetical protein
MQLGKLGIWRRRQHGAEAVEEIEALGYGTLWLGSSPAVGDARPMLERTSTLVVATASSTCGGTSPLMSRRSTPS